MKLNLKFGLAVASSAVLFACNSGSPDNGKDEVEAFNDLPSCIDEKGNPVEDTLYVVEKDMFYACYGEEWKVVNVVDTIIDFPTCKPGSKTSVDLGYEMQVKSSGERYVCTDNGWVLAPFDEDAPRLLENTTVSGSAIGFGPFVFGSSVYVSEVMARGDSVLFTGNEYFDEISNDKGDFVVPNVTLNSGLAVVRVTGLFRDPMTGKVSEDSITLKGLLDLASGETNVNLLTHMEYDRVLALVSEGYSLLAAKKQAGKEIIHALGFSENVEMSGKISALGAEDEDAMLLGLMVLFRGETDAADLSDKLTSFAEDFSDGVWDDTDMKTAMADFAYNLENMKFVDKTTKEIRLQINDFRKNMESWNIGTIAAFEKPVNRFWSEAFGLGGCSLARDGFVMQNANEASDSSDAFFTCVAEQWRLSTDIEKDTLGLGYAEDGTMSKGQVNSDIWYVYDTTGTGAGTPTRWKEADSISVVIGYACSDADDSRLKVVKTKNADGDDNYYHCLDRMWTPSSQTAYTIGYPCAEEFKYEMKKTGTDKFYRCIDYNGTYVWNSASKVDFLLKSATCNLSELVTWSSKGYVCTDSVTWIFREATELESDLDLPCSNITVDSIVENDGKSYVCAEEFSQFKWRELSAVEKKLGICNAAAFGSNGNVADDGDYTCGCDVYNTATLKYDWMASPDECGYSAIEWTKLCSLTQNLGGKKTENGMNYVCGCQVESATPGVMSTKTDMASCSGKNVDWQIAL